MGDRFLLCKRVVDSPGVEEEVFMKKHILKSFYKKGFVKNRTIKNRPVMKRVEAGILTLFVVMGAVFFSSHTSVLGTVYGADYTNGGCVRWVKSCAMDLGIVLPSTGYNRYGVAGANNYWYTLPKQGFLTGSTPRKNSIAVWEFSASKYYSMYGHVAFVTKVKGNKITLTEGGLGGSYTYKENTGVREVVVTKSTIKNMSGRSGFLGYIYLPYSGQTVLKGTKVSSVQRNIGTMLVHWKKQKKNTDGFELVYSTNKQFKDSKKVKIKSFKTTSSEITGVKDKKTYYVKIRTYKTVFGKKYYSKWSGVKKVKKLT